MAGHQQPEESELQAMTSARLLPTDATPERADVPGYSSGAYATAAAKGAARMLRDQQHLETVEIILPHGEAASFRLHGQRFDSRTASCHVTVAASDAPDSPSGVEIHASVTLVPATECCGISICGGTGIGRIAKPGLDLPVGEWAINQQSLRMIKEAVHEVFPLLCPVLSRLRAPAVPHVSISIPNGAALAEKTLHARIGISGGLSILDSSGCFTAVSSRDWTRNG
jgi:cobalt-precorrin-5B (C1)-methyltransferase